MIVAGRVSQKMAPVLRQIYDQMPNPKWVLAMGVCASTGGMFNNYAIVQGVDHVVPVDMYLPGCPPRPEMLIDAMFKLRDKVAMHRRSAPTPARRHEEAEQRQLEAPATHRDEGPAAMSDTNIPPKGDASPQTTRLPRRGVHDPSRRVRVAGVRVRARTARPERRPDVRSPDRGRDWTPVQRRGRRRSSDRRGDRGPHGHVRRPGYRRHLGLRRPRPGRSSSRPRTARRRLVRPESPDGGSETWCRTTAT